MAKPQVLDLQQEIVAKDLSAFRNNYYLAGGTSIALQLRHRKSIDFDLFTSNTIDSTEIIKNLNESLIESVLVNSPAEYTIIYNQVKVTFLNYPFSINITEGNTYFRMPHLLDLAAMKAYTLGRRSKWKDYVDMYYLSVSKFGLSTIERRAKEIFSQSFSNKLFREQLVYFDDIDFSEEVQYLDNEAPDKIDIENYFKKIVAQ